MEEEKKEDSAGPIKSGVADESAEGEESLKEEGAEEAKSEESPDESEAKPDEGTSQV